jgi:3-isopropylmalate/(R)-2-methylmalate dehydratase large subunit
LRDDVSTDEITPVPILTHYDDKLGRYPYTGLAVGGARPIGVDAVRAGGFSVTVAGKRYGKGSSREHSPAAERLAGIRLVVAESFERIYRQNADNIGLFTSTDFALVDASRRRAIASTSWCAGRDALAAAILKSGGLLRFGQRSMRDVRPGAGEALDATPRTLFEKIVARRALSTELTPADPRPGEGAFVRADWRFIHEYYTGMCAHMLDSTFGAALALRDPERIVAFEDHTSYVAESPAHVRGGLVPNVAAMCRATARSSSATACARTARSPKARPRATTAATSPASRTR